MTTTLAHLSDLHFGRVNPIVAEGLLADLDERKPDLIVVSGDFTQSASHEEYAAARAYLGRLPREPLCVPGNHDLPAFNLWQRFFKPVGRFRKYIESDLFPVQDCGQISIIGVNTARSHGLYLDWSRGRLNRGQMARIRQQFHELAPNRLKVLVTHHPFLFPPEGQYRHLIGLPKGALEELASCGVDLLLAGHFHKAYSGLLATRHPEVKEIVVAQTATTISTRAAPNAYNWIRYGDGQLKITSREWSDDRFVSQGSKVFQRGPRGAWIRMESKEAMVMSVEP